MAQKEKKIGILTRGSSDFILIVVTMLLVALGLIMVLSASSPSSLSEYGDSYHYLRQQAIAATVGIAGMFVLSRFDYNNYKKFKWLIYVASVAMLVAVKFFGMEAGGAKRWINIFGFNFQPSEVSKVAFIIFFAAILSDLQENRKIKTLGWGCWFPLVFLIPIIISIYVLQNHFSATLIICAVTVVQMFIAGTTIKNFLITAGMITPFLCGFLAYKMGDSSSASENGNFRATRIKTWLDPFAYPTGEGWQIIQSLYAIGSGGLFGVGLGESKQKYLYLPEPQNDFIFAVLAEELGFFGCMVVIILFTIFIWRGVVIALRARDNFGTLIAIGIVTLIGLQAIINIAVVTGTIPVTGMPLPFFSYGGTAILVNLCAVGILLNISRSVKKQN